MPGRSAQRPGERDEQARHTTDLGPPAEAQLPIEARRHRQLRDAQPGADGELRAPTGVHSAASARVAWAPTSSWRAARACSRSRAWQRMPRRYCADGGDPCGTALAAVGRDRDDQSGSGPRIVDDAEEIEQAGASRLSPRVASTGRAIEIGDDGRTPPNGAACDARAWYRSRR